MPDYFAEYEYFVLDYEAGILYFTYIDTDEYEYEYSLNAIEEARGNFIKMANEYLAAIRSPYEMGKGLEGAVLFHKATGQIVRRWLNE